ncbi:hypothetical protein [Mycobacterium montefiorense]|uniref:Uncharacterized protein n=1 Tax=Mycobacterium montefiorense TaxID=154654 RepID=A0AA37PIX0_9MYCO|nr:hypothetical protein [Mycobacterium montefiorense]GBG38297.1 hypothetical protein MmonteBS_26690 [Mycobacterium montefiorense]GKU36189.1 hypothetical protein NJB14191_35350 [Mycobacterium montefiorense]GKU38744.1 hypothetical protein NJB14192_07410 [Mycobacterium montefiorense]GKU48260.1 hypothetical protein NJB14194_48750 [Mycobacterium montefiorense]GKU53933.1 hypothetical protein NJB14195_51740 [Mycobacterium montefiorense]
MASIFDPDDLHAITRSVAGRNDGQATCAQIVDELKQIYPRYVSDKNPWLFNRSGGGQGQLKVLHCSMFEYLLLYGTPTGTPRRSGREWIEVWDFVFDGELWCCEEGKLEPTVYRPGRVAHLGKGRTMGWAVPSATFMLEYARGPVQAMPPFGVADSILNTLACWTAGASVSRSCRMA